MFYILIQQKYFQYMYLAKFIGASTKLFFPERTIEAIQ